MITLWAAFMTGLVGSLHCAGMCGPICLALPLGDSTRTRTHALLQYHAGRIGTYVLLGTFFGLLGAGVRLAGFQSWLSVAAGAAMVVIALLSIDVEGKLARWLPLRHVTAWVHTQLAQLLRRGQATGLWRLGALNGLLPCGLVYLAIAGALTLGNAGWGALYLLAFGLGTLPLLMITGLFGHYAGQRMRRTVRQLYPVLLGGLGAWLIYRGVVFHLPANFQFLQALDSAPMCH